LLLCGAGLLLRTLAAYGSVDAGHRTDALLTVFPSIDYGLPTSMFGSEAQLRQFLEGVETEVRSIPAVENAGWTLSLPLGGFNPVPLEVVGEQSERTRASAQRQIVSPGYFATLGVSLVDGRGFSERDGAESPPVCIVSESFARQHLGGRNPIGMRLAVPQLSVGPRQSIIREIVGVAADVRLTFDESAESRAVYVPVAQNPWSFLTLLVEPRAGPPEAVLPDVRAAAARIDRRVPIAARTLEDYLQLITARPRFRAVMVSTFAGLSLALAMVGVFGVLAYSVQQRRREFGVRIALGASTATVLRLVLGGAGRLIGSGTLLGLVLAAVFAQSMSTFLFGVRPLDPLTFAGVILVLGATAALASAIPAVRASQVDPVVAFRND
jgi:putative ABC transport system permease protein